MAVNASRYHITPRSHNRKTGNIVVTTSSNHTCPSACPFKGAGCYAECGPLQLHWSKVSSGERGTDFDGFLSGLAKTAIQRKATPENRPILRLWQAGDFPGEGDYIDFEQIRQLVDAAKPFRAFGYTHKPPTENNMRAIRYCNENGVTVNLSANNLSHADDLYDLDIGPVATVVPSYSDKPMRTPKGRTIIICPAAINDEVHCENCGGGVPLCSRKRDYIIGFPAHGASARKVDEIFAKG